MGFTDRAGKDRAWKEGAWIVARDHCWKTLSDEKVASIELRGEWNIYSMRKEKLSFVGKRGQNVQERG